MWNGWIARYCQLGALAAVSSLAPNHDPYDTSSWDTSPLQHCTATWRHANRHIFPSTPLSHHLLFPDMNGSRGKVTSDSKIDELVAPSSPCKDMSYCNQNGLNVLTSSHSDGASQPEWKIAEQQKVACVNHIARKYLQPSEEFKFGSNGGDSETTSSGDKELHPWQTPKTRYADIRSEHWQQLVDSPVTAVHGRETLLSCGRVENDNGSSTGHDRRSKSPDNSGTNMERSANIGRLLAHERQGIGRGRLRDWKSPVEMDMIVSSKWIGDANDLSLAGHQERVFKSIDKNGDVGITVLRKEQNFLKPTQQPGYVAVSSVMRENGEGCRVGKSRRQRVGRSQKNSVSTQGTKGSEDCSSSGRDGSVCSGGSGGIAHGQIAKDEPPLSRKIPAKPWERGLGSEGAVCNGKDDDRDGIIQNCTNWCIVDSYITGNGKETSWTVQGFEEDGVLFDESVDLSFPDLKEGPLLSDSRQGFGGLMVAKLPLEGKMFQNSYVTQQALQVTEENRLEEAKDTKGITDEDPVDQSDDGSTVGFDSWGRGGQSLPSFIARDASRRQALLDELASIGNKLHCRIGGQSPKEASLLGIHDSNQGGETDGSANNIQQKIAETKRDVGRCSNASLTSMGSTTSDCEKDEPGGTSLRDFQRRKRGWLKKRRQSPAAAVACAASMIGDTVQAVRRAREDASALAFKLAELHAHDAKALRYAASVMRHHVDSLHSEVQGFQTIWVNKTVEYPWQHFIKDFIISVSLVSGAFSYQIVLNALRRVLGFGSGNTRSFQIPATRKEKMVLATVVLSIGARFGSGVWQSLGHVRSEKKAQDAELREKLRLILERTLLMMALAQGDPTVVSEQAEDYL